MKVMVIEIKPYHSKNAYHSKKPYLKDIVNNLRKSDA